MRNRSCTAHVVSRRVDSLPALSLATKQLPHAGEPPKKHTILFLAENPSDTGRLALDREAHAIHVELKRSG
jgi:hypothetical protein